MELTVFWGEEKVECLFEENTEELLSFNASQYVCFHWLRVLCEMGTQAQKPKKFTNLVCFQN